MVPRRVSCVVGARPNFVKMAPLLAAMSERGGFDTRLVHTGQHYDRKMSQVFFDELDLPAPDVHLGVGSGSHAEQTAAVMVAFERELGAHRPDLVVVVGDVNSTLASAVVAAKMCVPVAHVEAGLRSFDRSMPEEVNRIVTDSLSSLLFTTEDAADANLIREGHPRARIHHTGNVMIDALLKHLPRARELAVFEPLGLRSGQYALVTMHRPSNVDDPARLRTLMELLASLSQELPVLFPVHPRTLDRLGAAELSTLATRAPRLRLEEPKGYLDFLNLMAHARLLLTDSGGIQEEATVLGVPCLTLRENTERPVTVELGTSTLVGNDPERIWAAIRSVLEGRYKAGGRPADWDGHAARRVAAVLAEWRPV